MSDVMEHIQRRMKQAHDAAHISAKVVLKAMLERVEGEDAKLLTDLYVTAFLNGVGWEGMRRLQELELAALLDSRKGQIN